MLKICHFFQGRSEGGQETLFLDQLTQLGSPVYWVLVALATLVFLLGAAVIAYIIRDTRHQGRKEILRHVQSETQEVRALCLELHQAKQELEAAKQKLEAAKMAKAAKADEELLLVSPSKILHNSVGEEQKVINSFSNPTYRPELNPFENQAAVSKQQQQQPLEVVAEVVAVPKQQQQQPLKVVAAPMQQLQKQQPLKVVAAPMQQQEQLLEVVVAPMQQQQQQKAEAAPGLFSAFDGVRSKLENIFEPRPVKQRQHQQKVVVTADVHPRPKKLTRAVEDAQQQEQPEVINVVAAPQQQQKSEVVYASLIFPQPKGPQPKNAMAAFGQKEAASHPSIKMRKAPPPPTLVKPKIPLAGIARAGTLPRSQKSPPREEGASNQADLALSKPKMSFAGIARGGTLPRTQKPPPREEWAASNLVLNQADAAASRRAPPPPPQRRSSLSRSLNSLRRKRAIPTGFESKKDFPSEFLTKYGLWDEDECYVTYV